MAAESVQYGSTLNADTSRGPSPAIWNKFPILSTIERPGQGMHFWEEFNSFPSGGVYNGERTIGKWATWIGNNSGAYVGTGADSNLPQEGGVIGIYGGTTAIDVTLQATQSAYRLVSPATGYPMTGKLAFECSIAVNNVTSAYGDLFVGLMDTGEVAGTRVTSAASMAFSATNTLKTATGMGGCLGFWKRATTNPTDVALVHNVNAGTVQNLGSSSDIAKLSTNYAGGAMAALSVTNGIPAAINSSSGACFIKLGFIFDPQASPRAISTALSGQTSGAIRRPLLEIFVNGKKIAPFYDSGIIQASTFPSSFLSPTIAYRSGGTGAMIAYVDWVRCYQVANS